jgi:hypothetical protein
MTKKLPWHIRRNNLKLALKKQLEYQKKNFNRLISLNNLKLENQRIVSIGHACQVPAHIKNFNLNNNETEFFDWLISDFSSIYYLLNNKDNDIFDINNFTDQSIYTDQGSSDSCLKIEHKKFKMISLHDYSINISWDIDNPTPSIVAETNNFLDKYKRRWIRFKTNFKNFEKNKLISVFDHQFTKCYIPTREEIKNVLDKLSTITDNEIQIHFIWPTYLNEDAESKEFQNMINGIDCCYYHVLKQIDGFTRKSTWIDSHLNWYEIMFNILNS